ncbi:MAG: hypothetical protein PHH16_02075 [Candidatus Gracilibacteria bacterium]|nr:hypothetical protein [Candidatus Gracilibacteria bacterium]
MQTILQKLEPILGAKQIPSPEEKKLFQRTQDFIGYIGWIPGLRMVAVSNSLAMYATHENSDIDLFIITAPHRLWIVRTLVLLVATLLRVRAKPGDEAGKFCFPFFMTEKNMNLKEIALEDDIYLAYWIRTLKPIYNQDYTYGRLMEVNRDFYENTLRIHPSEEERSALLRENRTFLVLTWKHPWATKLGIFLSPILSFKDMILGLLSKWYITKKIPSGNTEGIIMNDDMLKLHFTDRRREIRDQIMGSIK